MSTTFDVLKSMLLLPQMCTSTHPWYINVCVQDTHKVLEKVFTMTSLGSIDNKYIQHFPYEYCQYSALIHYHFHECI